MKIRCDKRTEIPRKTLLPRNREPTDLRNVYDYEKMVKPKISIQKIRF